MLSDTFLPSIVKLIGGPDVKGSWWGHERGHQIFSGQRRLEASPNALSTRLVSGKVTYLHRRFWSSLLSVATAKEEWQTFGLDPSATKILRSVEAQGRLRIDTYPNSNTKQVKGGAKELERRLLVYTEELHTESGKHTKVLMTWGSVPKLEKTSPGETGRSKEILEDLVDGLNTE